MIITYYSTTPILYKCCACIKYKRRQSHCIGQDVMKQLASAFILSRLDYCNSILPGLPKSMIVTLPRVQNGAARMVFNLRPRDSISDGLWQMHLIHTGHCPSYISDTVQLVADHASRTGLRSATTAFWYILPRLQTVFSFSDQESASRSVSFDWINLLTYSLVCAIKQCNNYQ